MSCDKNNCGKEKSNLKMSDILGSEPSGISKFNHEKDTVHEALNMTEKDLDRIGHFGMTLKPPTSRAMEDILTSDKLHNTLERVLCAFQFGRHVESMNALMMMKKMFDKLD